MMRCAFTFILFFLAVQASACEITVSDAAKPASKSLPQCLNDFLEPRFQEIGLQYHNQIIFESKSSPQEMSRPSRLSAIFQIYEDFGNSVKDAGTCRIELFAGNRKLSLKDFNLSDRSLDGMVGTRLILRSYEVGSPRWELVCRDSQGESFVSQTGEYFFIFVDVYENLHSTSAKRGHFAQFLWSLN